MASVDSGTALIQPNDRLMGLGLPDGGHLTHGYYVRLCAFSVQHQPEVYCQQTAKKKMTASSIYFQSFPYSIVPETGLIDYELLTSQAKIFKPRLIICGASAYPRDWDYSRLKAIAEKEGAYLMADIAHTSGLIAAQELNNLFEYCDVVTTTTYARVFVSWTLFDKPFLATKPSVAPAPASSSSGRTLKNAKDLEKCVNDAACQGGPHNNTIAAIATSLLQVAQPTWKAYAKQVIANAQTLSATLGSRGSKVVYISDYPVKIYRITILYKHAFPMDVTRNAQHALSGDLHRLHVEVQVPALRAHNQITLSLYRLVPFGRI
ncbi:hypothetical protein C0991_005358 [Blastosporella zonata]|nr:hypothetical protein C0991_005358 [Blastosporella zonata]